MTPLKLWMKGLSSWPFRPDVLSRFRLGTIRKVARATTEYGYIPRLGCTDRIVIYSISVNSIQTFDYIHMYTYILYHHPVVDQVTDTRSPYARTEWTIEAVALSSSLSLDRMLSSFYDRVMSLFRRTRRSSLIDQPPPFVSSIVAELLAYEIW